MDFRAFYRRATGYDPYPYQLRLAEGPWPDLVDVPTGLGKTSAVALAWLYRRYLGEESAPTRLIWCLPMRTLVEQTRDVVDGWIANLRMIFEEAGRALPTAEKMMGGEQQTHWASHPEHPAVVVGTQDMLLSRALMRGYGMSRYAWPMHFAWVHNDALWVFDETQLMGVGVETSAQLDAFRRLLGSAKPAHSLWMSATLGQAQLETIDHPRPNAGWRTVQLDGTDLSLTAVQQRTNAKKPIERSAVALDSASAKSGYAEQLARQVLERHKPGSLTLVILNRVSRAQDVYRALKKAAPQQTTALLHSRFRPADRRENYEVLTRDGDRIIVSTQVVEAGVDVSARTLFTELAPWPSLVQRFGRCNRYGEFEDARVEWIDVESDAKQLPLPYETSDLDTARALLHSLTDVGPASLTAVQFTPPSVVRPVLRRKDLVELFDTTPDLSGNDLDVSRYVRDESTDSDVSVFWRDIEEPDKETTAPGRDELCTVTLSAMKDFLKKKSSTAYRFDPLDKKWTAVTDLQPGQTILVTAASGGYDAEVGFTGEPPKKGASVPTIAAPDTSPPEGMGDEPESVAKWLSLLEHVQHVVDDTAALTQALGVDDSWRHRLEVAANWHDVGKAHEVFQKMMTSPGEKDAQYQAPNDATLWAKSNHQLGRAARRGFRHELASALAFLQHFEGEVADVNAIAYLIAAHHGKVRLSIRSLPNETAPGPEVEGLFARGVWHGDILPALELPDGTQVPETKLDLRLMRLGRGSWLERTLSLRDAVDIGPFRLAWYESLLRVADQRASARERRGTA